MKLSRAAKRNAPRALAILAALGGLFASCGWPAPPPRPVTGDSYPCQSRPCGCVTAEKCWAGDCCCFTLGEKLSWADARGVEVPAHVRPMVAARAKSARPKCAACAPPQAAPRWVIGPLNEKCRNKGPNTIGGGAVLFAASPARPALLGAPATGFGPAVDALTTSTTHVPPTPPPRRA